jgi:hypothetical protein
MEIIGLILLLVVLLIMAASSGGVNPPASNASAPHYPAPGHYPPAPLDATPYAAPRESGATPLPVLMFLVCLALFVYFYRDLKARIPELKPTVERRAQQHPVEELVPKPEPRSQNIEKAAAPKPHIYDADPARPSKTLREFDIPEADGTPAGTIELRRRTEMHALKLGVYSSLEGVEMLKHAFSEYKIEALYLTEGEYWACLLFDAPADVRDAFSDWKTRRRTWVSYGIEPEPVNLHHVCTRIVQEKRTGVCSCIY